MPNLSIKQKQFTVSEFMYKQFSDQFCEEASPSAIMQGLPHSTYRCKVLISYLLTDSAFQKIVPKSLQATMLHLTHYLVLSRRDKQRYLYDRLYRDYYWAHIVKYFNDPVERCLERSRMREVYRHNGCLRSFPPKGSLISIAIDISGPLLKTWNENQSVIFMGERYSKPTSAVPRATRPSSHTALKFIDNGMGYIAFPYSSRDIKDCCRKQILQRPLLLLRPKNWRQKRITHRQAFKPGVTTKH